MKTALTVTIFILMLIAGVASGIAADSSEGWKTAYEKTHKQLLESMAQTRQLLDIAYEQKRLLQETQQRLDACKANATKEPPNE
jgi:hypothetical protein